MKNLIAMLTISMLVAMNTGCSDVAFEEQNRDPAAKSSVNLNNDGLNESDLQPDPTDPSQDPDQEPTPDQEPDMQPVPGPSPVMDPPPMSEPAPDSGADGDKNKDKEKDKESDPDQDSESPTLPMNPGNNGDKNKDKEKNKDKHADLPEGTPTIPCETGSAKECVVLCHVPPGNPAAAHTIIVGAPAVNAHLTHHQRDDHGDYLGVCEEQL